MKQRRERPLALIRNQCWPLANGPRLMSWLALGGRKPVKIGAPEDLVTV